MRGSPLRAIVRLFGYFVLTVPLMPVQGAALALRLPLARRLPNVYHRICCRLFGIEVEVSGEISAVRPTLFVVNHQSYLDVTILSAVVETCFVAKHEVARWPFFGWLAKLQNTVFVARRVSGVTKERDDVARRLAEGNNLVLFAEGTSGEGTRMLPFKRALFSVAEQTVDGQPLVVQPVTIAYTRLDGMPIGRQWRPFFSWYGDMALASHLWCVVGLGRITTALEFHPPVTIAEFGTRKALAEYCEREVARGLAAAHAGRQVPRPPPAGAAGAPSP
ncbi:MAG: 1-acyl-sn-glycerol-3-phosphate acyltransferase [Proteobacteria bacterium]|nr:1-acyl-sn-glycerol-3-phosphate acyltransferase [Pseudomonadota bacterium]